MGGQCAPSSSAIRWPLRHGRRNMPLRKFHRSTVRASSDSFPRADLFSNAVCASASKSGMQALPSYPLDEELDSDILDLDDEDFVRSPRSASALAAGDEDTERPTRPALQSGVQLGANLNEVNFGQRAELEWRLYHRGRFAPE